MFSSLWTPDTYEYSYITMTLGAGAAHKVGKEGIRRAGRLCFGKKKSAPRQWTFGDHKSSIIWDNRMKKRNWTIDQIDEAINNGIRVPAQNKVNPGNAAGRYIHPSTKQSVVLDETIDVILHIGKHGDRYD